MGRSDVSDSEDSAVNDDLTREGPTPPPEKSGKEAWVTPLSTGPSGQLDNCVDEDRHDLPVTGQTDLTRTALDQAQGLGRPVRRRRKRGANGGPSYSGPAPDERDPQRVGGVLAGLFADRGWQRPVTEARIFADWPGLVGEDVARHCEPVSLREGELRISAESTAWATQLRLMATKVLARLADELGAGVVTRLVVTGPTGPSWKHGAWSVRGARGPRDTYG
jgi:predicted nucleic acid-binding Zn ribbon protein